MTISNSFWSRWMTIVSLIVAVGGIVAWHFNGISEAKIYTDQKVGKLEAKVDRVYERQESMQSDLAVIKSILQRRRRD